jgi:hypothetical protein
MSEIKKRGESPIQLVAEHHRRAKGAATGATVGAIVGSIVGGVFGAAALAAAGAALGVAFTEPKGGGADPEK